MFAPSPSEPDRSRWRYSRDDIPPTTSMDTETTDGVLKVICTKDAFFEPQGEEGSDLRAISLLDWIWEHGADIIWLWNLQFDRDVICRPIAFAQLADEEKVKQATTEHVFRIDDYTIKLVGGKSFSLQRKGSHRKKTFFDAGTFYRENEVAQPLDRVAHEVLGYGKNAEELGIDRARIGSEKGYYEQHRELIIKYCMRDAEITEKLGNRLFETAARVLRDPETNEPFYPRRWASAASLSKAWLERNASNLVSRQKRRHGATHHPMRSAYRGGMFLSKLGRVEGVKEVDLVNAYGSALMHMPRQDQLTEPIQTDRWSENAVMGSYFILIDYDGRLPARRTDAVAVPRDPERQKLERIAYPTSHGALRPYYADRVEMEWFREQGRDMVILTAAEMFPRDPGRPLGLQFPTVSVLLARVAALKKEAKSGNIAAKLEREFLKKVVNAIYGSMAEAKHGETPFTNWPGASFITAWTRRLIWQQWDAIEAGGGYVVSVNTDSIRYVPGNYDVPLTRTGEIGRFEPKFTNCTVVHYQSGVAAVLHEAGHDDHCSECAELERVVRVKGRWERRPPGGTEGFAIYLRKRGMPRLTADVLLNARGTELKTDLRRGYHVIEAMLKKDRTRMQEIGNIRGPVDEKDAPRIRPLRLDSNLMVFDVDPARLRFESLLTGPVECLPIDYDSMMGQDWNRSRIDIRRDRFGTHPTGTMRLAQQTTKWSVTVSPDAMPELVGSELGDGGVPFTPGQLVPPPGPRPMRLLREVLYPPPISGGTRHQILESRPMR